MRDIRDKINKEIINMDSQQVLEYFRLKAEEFEQKYGKPFAMNTGNSER